MDRLHPLNRETARREQPESEPVQRQRRRPHPKAANPRSFYSLGMLFVLVSLLGCDKDKNATGGSSAAPPARFEAVTKKSGVSEKDLDGFCDIRDRGPLKLPAISGGKEPEGARWVNLWATWCKSCVEEMPMIERWQKQQGIQVLYISADEESGALDAFLKEHPATPKTATMDEPGALTDWMRGLGLDEGAGLPLHLFVRADNTVACARAAAVSEHHLSLIKNLLK